LKELNLSSKPKTPTQELKVGKYHVTLVLEIVSQEFIMNKVFKLSGEETSLIFLDISQPKHSTLLLKILLKNCSQNITHKPISVCIS